ARRRQARRPAQPPRAVGRGGLARRCPGTGALACVPRRPHDHVRRGGDANRRSRGGGGVRGGGRACGRQGAAGDTPSPEPRGAVRARGRGRAGGLRMSGSLKRVWAVGLVTFREAIRNRVLAVLVLFAVAL